MTVAAAGAIGIACGRGDADRIAALEKRLDAIEERLKPFMSCPLPGAEAETVTEAPAFEGGFFGTTGSAAGEFDFSSRKVLAEGEGLIRGRVLAAGEPRAGLRLRLLLSGNLRTAWATSDSDGVYLIRVPPGRYYFQGYELDPASANEVLAGMVQREGEMGYAPAPIEAQPDRPGTGPDFEFVPAIAQVAPAGDAVVSRDRIEFEWEAIPGAAEYRVDLMDGGTDGRGSWRGVFWGESGLASKSNRLLLAGRDAERLESGHRYSWSVTAYDTAHRVISRSPTMNAEFRVE